MMDDTQNNVSSTDLLTLGQFEGIGIVTARQAVDRVGG